MYIPKHFEETRVDVLHALIETYPLATLITHSTRGLNANHVPMYLTPEPAPYGTLRAHVARGNALVEDLTENPDVLAVFQGPNAYISPSWYATKEETGRVVPTWNYATVHAKGRARAIDDPVWLRAQITALTERNEAPFAEPWSVDDAPADYIDKLIGSIVGVEIELHALHGKSKVSQNQPAANAAGVLAGLRACDQLGAQAMADLVRERAKVDPA